MLYMNYGLFLKKYSLFKISDLLNKRKIDNNFPLPIDSTIHIIDNFDSEYINSDTFNVENYPFLNKENILKINIYHNSKFGNISLLKIKNKLPYSFKYISAGLNANLKKFNQANLSIFKPIFSDNDLYKLNKKEKELIVINHNPLYRFMIKTGGDLRDYYKFDIIFSSIINFIKTNFQYKHKFLFIPLNHKIQFKKDSFINIISSDKVIRSKLEYNSFLYYILIQLISFLTEKSKFKSYFSLLDEYFLNNFNIVFFNDNLEYYIFNLSKLKEICENNESNRWKILDGINSINMEIDFISSKSISPTIGIVNEYENIPIKEIDKIDIPLEDDHDEIVFRESSEKFETDLLKDTNDFIDINENLTFNQKERLKEKAKTFQSLEVIVNGKSQNIKSIINNRPDATLEPINVKSKLNDLNDKSYGETKVINMNQKYMDTFFYHDLFQNILNLQKGGLFLIDYKENDVRNDFSKYKQMSFKFEDIKGKTHNVKCRIPLLDKDGYFKINGIKSIMKHQLVNLPICKISHNRVSLASNFNKTLVEKNTYQRFDFYFNFNRSIIKHNKKYPNDQITLIFHDKYFKDKKLPYEYTSIGKKIKKIQSKELYFYFNYDKRESILNIPIKELKALEKKYGIICGKNLLNKNIAYFINDKNELNVINYKVPKRENITRLINILISEDSIINSYDWCHLKILDKPIPIIFVLGYRFGFIKTLKYLKLKYKIVSNTERYKLKFDEMKIKFADKSLIYKKYPLLKSWIVNGLLYFSSLKEYNLDSLNYEDSYYRLLQDKNISTNYLKGIDNFFTFFIDGITRDILKQMKEPTNTRDLLIRSVELLTTEDYIEPSALVNFRQRSLEKINGIIYNEITRQYSQYLNNKTKDLSFSINTESIFQRILQDQSVVLAEEINPVHYLKERTAITHVGFSGRSSEAFVERDRKYPSDGIGILSEATPDSGKVAINAFLSFNPNIKDIRGFYDIENKKTDPGNILSVTGSLLPFITNDDPKRANFANIQLSHHIPTEHGRPGRIRTGFESIISDFCGDLYSVIANDDGEVININTKDNICLIKYKNKDITSFEFGTKMGEVSGTILNHHIKLLVKEKSKFKKGDVLAYNTGFFKYDHIFKTLNWKHGVFGNIAIVEKDETLEDGSAFTVDFANNFDFDSIYMRPIKITSDLSIIDHANIGDVLEYQDNLINLEYKDISTIKLDEIDQNVDEAKDLLQELNRISIKSKHKGELIKYKIYYTGDLNEFDKSVIDFVNKYTKKNDSLYRSMKQSKVAEEYIIISKIESGTRIKNIQVNENELLILFYISEKIDTSVGDKFILDSSLKSVNCKLYDNIETKSGIKLDGIFGATSVFNRIILSPIKFGILERILEKIEKTAIKMYFDEEKK